MAGLRRIGYAIGGAPALERERDKLAGVIDRRWLTWYERSLGATGRGLTMVRERVCQGCFVTLPTSAAPPARRRPPAPLRELRPAAATGPERSRAARAARANLTASSGCSGVTGSCMGAGMRGSGVSGRPVLAAWVTASGCSTMRELPRSDYAAEPERKGVRVETREGLVYEFDSATFDPDSLTGYRAAHRTSRGRWTRWRSLKVALDDIAGLRTRRVDWLRTGLVGGAILAGCWRSASRRPSRGETAQGPGPCTRCPSPSGAGH